MITENIRGSIIKLCSDLIDVLTAEGLTGFELLDFDTHANLQELPPKDLLGPVAIGFTDNGNIMDVSFGIGVATYQDVNLFKSWKAISKAFELVRPTKKVTLYDSDTLEEIGFMTVEAGTMVSPVTKAEVRPFQFVQASLTLVINE